LGTKHKRIDPQAFPINLGFHRKITKAIEAGFGFGFNATVEQTVDSVDGQVVMVKYKDGEKKIIVPLDATILAYAVGSRDSGRSTYDSEG